MLDRLSMLAKSILDKEYGYSNLISWESVKEEGRGDFSSAVAFGCAKKLKKRPQEIAYRLAEGIGKDKAVEKAEAAEPGYVNVWLTSEALLEGLNVTREVCIARVTRKEEAPVIVDYCGPNIAKPLGIHHLLPHTIGQAIVNLYRHLGWNVIGWSYPGDWGTQFGKLYIAYKRWGRGKKISDYTVEELLELYVRFHKEAQEDDSLEEEARKAFRLLEKGDEEIRQFWKGAVEVSRDSLGKLYSLLQISIDKETGESFYEDKIGSIIKEGLEKGVITKGEGGALIVEFPQETALPPLLLRKSDGSTLYATRDLAMVKYRIDEFEPKSIYYVVDRAQSLHFQQLFEVSRRFGWHLPEMEHTVFGRMSFKDRKMSTREGTVLRLEEVLEEAIKRADAVIDAHGDDIQTDDREGLKEMMGIGALAYGVLSQNRKMDIVFDWDKFLSFEGNSAPYLQYTHARAKSVLRKSAQAEFEAPDNSGQFTGHERNLVNLLFQFAYVLEEARKERMPHVIANYLYSLCREFNSFYNSEPILKADGSHRLMRLYLTFLTASVLKTGAGILTIRLPERM